MISFKSGEGCTLKAVGIIDEEITLEPLLPHHNNFLHRYIFCSGEPAEIDTR